MLPFAAHVIHFNMNFAEKKIKVSIINIIHYLKPNSYTVI